MKSLGKSAFRFACLPFKVTAWLQSYFKLLWYYCHKNSKKKKKRLSVPKSMQYYYLCKAKHRPLCRLSWQLWQAHSLKCNYCGCLINFYIYCRGICITVQQCFDGTGLLKTCFVQRIEERGKTLNEFVWKCSKSSCFFFLSSVENEFRNWRSAGSTIAQTYIIGSSVISLTCMTHTSGLLLVGLEGSVSMSHVCPIIPYIKKYSFSKFDIELKGHFTVKSLILRFNFGLFYPLDKGRFRRPAPLL